jgi:hypothetical protein
MKLQKGESSEERFGAGSCQLPWLDESALRPDKKGKGSK